MTDSIPILTIILPIIIVAFIVWVIVNKVKSNNKKKRDYKKLGGWLLFLVIMMWIGAILGISETAGLLNNYYSVEDSYINGLEYVPYDIASQLSQVMNVVILMIFSVIFTFISLYLVHKRKKSFVPFTISAWWFFGIASFIIIRNLLIFLGIGIWTAYLLKSKRVKKTLTK